MIFLSIIAATLLAGIGSVWLASFLSFGVLARYAQHMLSLAAGALLATAFMHLLPEAFEGGDEPHHLFAAFLIGVVFFFLLDKAELWHHSHEHGRLDDVLQADADHRQDPAPHGAAHAHDDAHHGHHHPHHHAAAPAPAGGHAHGHGHSHAHGGWAVLFGDGLHAFADGVLIASAFLADPSLGIVAALAVLAHEVPHHMGDIVVLRQTSGNDQRKALVKVSLAGAMTALGGAVGYFVVDHLLDWLPFFLVVASSSFVYVALADLIPQLQKRLSARQTLAQITWLAAGIAIVTLASGFAHAH
ncbi:MAG: Zinc transporter ZupT [Paracidovorax wautersii]|uniref:Zinc transporter ZupT n=1 Tax=Paracidovorax wautersii TaxID=1177982 RepID=A0A7V8JRC3_9BURK|nr:MAG: Zinc transporter ZupT [Paracidovorax wautersii]